MQENLSGTLAPYTERNSSGVKSHIEELFSEPEIKLTDEEKEEAAKFASGLFEGKIDGELKCEASADLFKLYQTPALEPQQTFYLSYFETQEGQKDLAKLGLQGASADKIKAALHDIELINSRVGEKTRKLIATNSLNWLKAEMAQMLQAGAEKDSSFVDFEEVKVHYKPEMFLDKLADLQAFRRFYRQIRADLKNDTSNLGAAKSALLNVYAARVNNMLIGMYPAAKDLGIQLQFSEGIVQTGQLAEKLEGTMPMLARAMGRERKEDNQDFELYSDNLARRLDIVRNGADYRVGQFTPVSDELLKLADELESNGRLPESLLSNISLSPEIVEMLDTVKWDAQQLKAFCEEVLSGWQKLSEYKADWAEIEARNGFADDEKWQIATHPQKKGLSINSAKRVVWIAESFKRSLTQESPAGVLPVSSHELAHLLQSEFDHKLAKQIPLAKIKGRRASLLREVGAIYQERKSQAILGRTRRTNLHYLQALEARLACGNKLQTARAFFNSYAKNKKLEGESLDAATELAVDRSLRLFRESGYDSQPLDYIEQELVMRELLKLPIPQAEAIMIAGSSFSLADLVKLHSVGLLNIPEAISAYPAEDVMHRFVSEYLPRYQQA